MESGRVGVFADEPMDAAVDPFAQSETEMVATLRAVLNDPPSPTFLERVRRSSP